MSHPLPPREHGDEAASGRALTRARRDCLRESQIPPGGLHPAEVPMFVSIGFDDNKHAGTAREGGVEWVLDTLRARANCSVGHNARTFDGTPVRVSFFVTTGFAGHLAVEDAAGLTRSWRRAASEQHELGNHTHSHKDGGDFDRVQWRNEIAAADDVLSNLLATTSGPLPNVRGFRAPFLSFNDELYFALSQVGITYDCSIEDGFQADHDGSTFHWPYTLDWGRRAHRLFDDLHRRTVGPHIGLWELPVHPVVVPDDSVARQYGVEAGLRQRVASRSSTPMPQGKITGFDYNLWLDYRMSKAEVVATLKYTFDLRLAGNRAPMLFGAHSDYYTEFHDDRLVASATERREAIVEFLDYVQSYREVRIVPYRSVVDWIRDPVALSTKANS